MRLPPSAGPALRRYGVSLARLYTQGGYELVTVYASARAHRFIRPVSVACRPETFHVCVTYDNGHTTSASPCVESSRGREGE